MDAYKINVLIMTLVVGLMCKAALHANWSESLLFALLIAFLMVERKSAQY